MGEAGEGPERERRRMIGRVPLFCDAERSPERLAATRSPETTPRSVVAPARAVTSESDREVSRAEPDPVALERSPDECDLTEETESAARVRWRRYSEEEEEEEEWRTVDR